jgi:hypothetical protein
MQVILKKIGQPSFKGQDPTNSFVKVKYPENNKPIKENIKIILRFVFFIYILFDLFSF